MATVSYDGHSFLLDGRRIWLVSGAIHYPRVPRELWRSRIRAARQAGLNCIETYVFWNAHETSPGRFTFEGDLDLRRFVRLVGEEGLFCMVRPGPFVCAEWDNGGLPPWLSKTEGIRLREGHPAFLEACARYLSTVMEQIRDLQITEPVKPDSVKPARAVADATPPAGGFTGQGGGPIVMMQVENEWFCHHPEASQKYNDELLRYMREAGCTVPVNNCNNLWQRVDRTIDTWNGARRLASDLRQLRVVQPEAPRVVTEYWPGWFDAWGGEHADKVDADLHLYRLAGIAAVGGQANQYMFHGGTNFGFWGGRTVGSNAMFMTTSYDYDAPLLEAGGRGAKYAATRRICTFQSQFGHVFAHASPEDPHAVVALSEDDHPPAVLQLSGSAGSIVFIFRAKADKRDTLELMLPNGLTLPVPMGPDRVAWLAMDTPLGGDGHVLSYTNLRPWAFVGRRMLVLFGPAGAQGLVAINDALFRMAVPDAKAPPRVEQHEQLTLVVLNTEQVDQAYITPTGLCVGACVLDDHDVPIAAAGGLVEIGFDGGVSRRSVKPQRKAAAPRLAAAAWQRADLAALIDGSSDAYRPIDGPLSLEQLDCPYGYGWYRLVFKRKPSAAGKLMAPLMGDRLHFFADGKAAGLFGLGPGASYEPVPIRLGKTTTILADNLGRMNYAWRVGERKGLYGHVYAVRPMAMGRPKVAAGRSPDPFVLRDYVPQHRVGESRPADALTWKLKTGRKPIVLEIDRLPWEAVLFVNGEPRDWYHPNQTAGYGRWLIESRGASVEIRLALFQPQDRTVKLHQHVKVWQCTANVTDAATWAFTPWSVPGAQAFSKGPARPAGEPCWWRCTFGVRHTDVPLWLEPIGMTKGQLVLNGRNAGRYFVATATGKAVPPQQRYYLPEPWLRTDADNELMLFDEHGARPARVRLVYDAMGPYNG